MKSTPFRVLLCMTSNIDYDQRMQRIAATLSQTYVISIYNRKGNSHSNYEIFEAKCFFNDGILFYLEFNLRLLIHLLSHRYDIVYLVDTDTLLGGGISASFLSNTYVWDSHEWFTEVPELIGRKFKKRVWKAIEKMFVKKMDICITVNDSLAKIFCDEYHKAFISIKNVPISRVKINNLNVAQKIIIYQGAVNKGRGLDIAIDAMQTLDGFVLHIYGNGDLLKELNEKVIENGLEKKVKFMGSMSPNILWVKGNESYIGLNLLENNCLNYYYSLANKFFDYMHLEIPSINMAFPEYTSILEQYEVGVAIQNLDASSLINAIQQLDDSNYRHSIIENCKKYKRLFCWETEQNKLIQAFNGLSI